MFTPLSQRILDRLAETDIDTLTPLQALNLLEELKAEIGDRKVSTISHMRLAHEPTAHTKTIQLCSRRPSPNGRRQPRVFMPRRRNVELAEQAGQILIAGVEGPSLSAEERAWLAPHPPRRHHPLPPQYRAGPPGRLAAA